MPYHKVAYQALIPLLIWIISFGFFNAIPRLTPLWSFTICFKLMVRKVGILCSTRHYGGNSPYFKFCKKFVNVNIRRRLVVFSIAVINHDFREASNLHYPFRHFPPTCFTIRGKKLSRNTKLNHNIYYKI